jgi:hypothetical protein
MIDYLERRVLLAAQPYDWRNVNIGGGGFVDGVFFDPTKQNVIYARTDIGGLYKTVNGGTNWQQLLDFANNQTSDSYQQMGVLSFALDPRTPTASSPTLACTTIATAGCCDPATPGTRGARPTCRSLSAEIPPAAER